MEISENTVIRLIESNAALTQSVTDVKERFDKAIPYLAEQHNKLNEKLDTVQEKVNGVEKKVWYFSGIGTSVGFAISHLGARFFGGK